MCCMWNGLWITVHNIMQSMYRECNGFIMVFSLIDKNSVLELKKLQETITRMKEGESVPFVWVGNKVRKHTCGWSVCQALECLDTC